MSTAVLAVDPPDAGAVQRLEREQLERLLQEQRLRKKPAAPEITLPGAPAPGEASQTRNIPVKGFLVDDSAILSAEEIHAVLAPYEGKTVSLADLFEAVAGLNKLYEEKQMPTARAFLPPQEIADGRVKIRLVEARVGEIHLGQVTQVTPGFVRDRLSLASGDLMSVSRLEDDLLRFNRLHEVQLRAGVQPGKAAGTTDLHLEAAEPKRDQYSVFVDNAGRYTVGEERLGFTARRAGLTGRGDSLLFSAVLGEGSDSYYLGYSVPLNARDLKLDLSYSRGGIEVVEGSFVPLDVSGTSQDFTVGLTRPLAVDAGRLWNAYARASAKESISEFGGVTQQNVDLLVLTAGVSGEQQDERSAWTLDANLSQGLKHFGGENVFTALHANAAWLERFTPRAQLLLRGGLQYSGNDLLPASEQFQLGGSASVRGYSEGLLSGRSGYLVSAELRYTLQNPEEYLTRDPDAPLFTGFVFLDHGGAFPYRPAPLHDVTGDDFLTGAGLGLLMDWKGRVQARLAVAWPLRDNPGETEVREPRLHAWLAYNW
ncbi:MAG: ShlB/FhaC/HecB family hemolysin secretion/activation protein [Pseudomonadota bacterium]